MNVVVYFRQTGGATASGYPSITHWTEDENEVPVSRYTEFETSDIQSLPVGVAEQLGAVNTWLEANGGVVVTVHTEIENGLPSRPAYGRARKDAAHHRAVLLVATGDEIDGRKFCPSSQNGVNVIVLKSPNLASPLSETASSRTPVVSYLRTSLAGAEADALLRKQRDAIRKSNVSEVLLAEFVEEETAGSSSRPQLAKALALCREHGAFLFIGTTDAIGGGEELRPDFIEVPYEVAYRKKDDWPDLIPITDCPYSVALLFGQQWVRGNVPLYLANGSDVDLVYVEVLSRGSALADGEILETNTVRKTLGTIPPRHARLLEAYNVYFDGDFVIEYQVAAKRMEGSQYRGKALFKDIPTRRWIEVRDFLDTRT